MANELPGAVPDEVREERRARLMDFQEDISTQRLEAKIDREMTVLVDEVDEEGALARSPGDAPEIDGLVIIPRATASRRATSCGCASPTAMCTTSTPSASSKGGFAAPEPPSW